MYKNKMFGFAGPQLWVLHWDTRRAALQQRETAGQRRPLGTWDCR